MGVRKRCPGAVLGCEFTGTERAVSSHVRGCQLYAQLPFDADVELVPVAVARSRKSDRVAPNSPTVSGDVYCETWERPNNLL